MNAAELAERLSRPAPRFLIELDVPPESRAQLAADQLHQFERGQVLWGRTGHPKAMDLMRETLTVLGSLQRDPVARQFCWLAEGALESCKDRSPATREILNALSQQVRSLSTQTFTLPEELALSLWQRISVTGGGETAAALRRHLTADLPRPGGQETAAHTDGPGRAQLQTESPDIPLLDPVVDTVPTVEEVATPQTDSLDIPLLDPVFDAVPMVEEVAAPQTDFLDIPLLDPVVDAVPTVEEVAAPQADSPDIPMLDPVVDAVPTVEEMATPQTDSLDIPLLDPVVDAMPTVEEVAAPQADSPDIPMLDPVFDAVPMVEEVATPQTDSLDIPLLDPVVDAMPTVEEVAAPQADSPDIPMLDPVFDAVPMVEEVATPQTDSPDIPMLDPVFDAVPMVEEVAAPQTDSPDIPMLDPVFDAVPMVEEEATPQTDSLDIPLLDPVVDAVPTVEEVAALQADSLDIPILDPVTDAEPTAGQCEIDAGIPDPSPDPNLQDNTREAEPMPREPLESIRWVPPSSGYTLPTRMEVPPLLTTEAPDEAPTPAEPVSPPVTESLRESNEAVLAATDTKAPSSPAALPELPQMASAPFTAPRQALSIEPHPQAAVFAALAAALQSNWQRIADGSAFHFNLFRDALLTLNDGLPSLGTPALAGLASTLLARADELPVSGPTAGEGEAVAEALDSLTDCLRRWPKLGEDDIETLEAHQRGLTAPPAGGAPLPEGALQQLAADMQSLSAAPAAQEPPPASISIADIPHLYTAPDEADVPSNAAMERAALGVTAQAHLTELVHGRSRAAAGGGIDNDMVRAAQALAAEAAAAGEPALGSLAGAFAAALDASRFHPAPVLEIGADVIAVLVDMIGSVQRGEPVEGAEDLVEVLAGLTPAAPLSLTLPPDPEEEAPAPNTEPAREEVRQQVREEEMRPEPSAAPASPEQAFELPDLSFDEEVMPPSAMAPDPEPRTPWTDEIPDLGEGDSHH